MCAPGQIIAISDKCIHLLFKQTLFHVGRLNLNQRDMALGWKVNLVHDDLCTMHYMRMKRTSEKRLDGEIMSYFYMTTGSLPC